MTSLADRHARPLPKGTPPLESAAADALLQELGHDWQILNTRLVKEFRFPNFAGALAFTNAVGAIAESENHHPDIHLAWGMVRIETWTHSVGGLSENDFILAAKIEEARRLDG